MRLVRIARRVLPAKIVVKTAAVIVARAVRAVTTGVLVVADPKGVTKEDTKAGPEAAAVPSTISPKLSWRS